MYAKAMIGIKSWLEPPLTHIRLKTVYDRNINSYGSQKKKTPKIVRNAQGTPLSSSGGRQSFTMQHRFSFGSCTWAQLVKYIERDNSEQFKVMFL